MTITSTSTLAEVLADYNDSLNWEGNITSARLHLAAIRWLLANRPADTSTKGHAFRFDQNVLASELKELKSFIDSQPSSGKSMFVRARLQYE